MPLITFDHFGATTLLAKQISRISGFSRTSGTFQISGATFGLLEQFLAKKLLITLNYIDKRQLVL